MNDKRKKFKKLAEGRTNAALTSMRKLRKLNNAKAYDFTKQDIEAVCKALEDEVNALREHFATEYRKPVFRLDRPETPAQTTTH